MIRALVLTACVFLATGCTKFNAPEAHKDRWRCEYIGDGNWIEESWGTDSVTGSAEWVLQPNAPTAQPTHYSKQECIDQIHYEIQLAAKNRAQDAAYDQDIARHPPVEIDQ